MKKLIDIEAVVGEFKKFMQGKTIGTLSNPKKKTAPAFVNDELEMPRLLNRLTQTLETANQKHEEETRCKVCGGTDVVCAKGVQNQITEARKEAINPVYVGMLRQWLNEDRACQPLVSNADIMFWLTGGDESYLTQKISNN